MEEKKYVSKITTSPVTAASYPMAPIRQPRPVLLFVAAFSSVENAFVWSRQRLEELFGPIELESMPFAVDAFTDYYAPTMGANLTKQFWAFRDLIDPGQLSEIKRTTNTIEDIFAATVSVATVERPLNLDPGYVDLAKLILASTKDHAHRIYLSNGVFGETTLQYTQKQWKSLPWSYPDYQSDASHDFLNRCRDYLKQKRQEL
jgi:hypothetical protein